ncbi:LysR family transcriptional regulator [Agaricicola taiwanensis]|uniref:LysR family transcriptional regulator n=1 Tax=Agaricicola taiwanensis TaxID=591372 RepID=A0A8J2YMM3_9RHOB|nr:LysR family transcriptional regulator [Agaricicola taiwanensis]GGE54169.1 LysR family transcriptional regulator [Agaricicola taiwanensis]
MVFDSRLLSGIGVLSAVVEAGSFVRAGEALGLTQSAVSRAVGRLEQRVGIRIFNRTARSISLTEEGRRFYEAVAPHLAGMEDAAIDAAGSSARVRGKLRVNVDGAFGHHVLTPRMQPFLDRYPELSVEVFVRDRMGDLVAEGFDVGIHFGPPEPSSLICRLLLETPVLTCASPDYLKTHGTPKHPKDLEDGHHCILMRDPSTGKHYGWDFLGADETVSVTVQGRLMVTDTGALLGACLGGLGIAQPLAIYSRDLLREGRLVQLLPEWARETFPLYVYHHSPNMMSAKVRAFLDYVAEIVSR